MTAPVIEYVSEEVSRQGHDLMTSDGIQRVAWMLNAWCYALLQHESRMPSLFDAINLGKMVEPVKNKSGLRRCGVRVGRRVCPEHESVPALLQSLYEHWTNTQPLEFYKEFELIHPFVDGNGRTGKILLNWLNGTLLAPIFPPDDLFGYPIRNS